MSKNNECPAFIYALLYCCCWCLFITWILISLLIVLLLLLLNASELHELIKENFFLLCFGEKH